jgi:hypothetical protein
MDRGVYTTSRRDDRAGIEATGQTSRVRVTY